jgi:hypothetical protein
MLDFFQILTKICQIPVVKSEFVSGSSDLDTNVRNSLAM